MKTAEEWTKEYHESMRALDKEADEKVGEGVVPVEDMHAIIIQQIQLDAMKEGMRRAAGMVFPFDADTASEDDLPWLQERKRILTAAEQLTKKDL